MLVVSGSVGAGHDGAANELASRLRAAGVHVDVRDYLHAVPRWYRVVLRRGYTVGVQRTGFLVEWLFVSIEQSRLVRGIVVASCRMGDGAVRRWLRDRDYDAVVSTYPLASQTLGKLRERGHLTAPAVTYLADPAAHPIWVHQSVDEHLTVTEASAEHGQRAYGVPMRAAGPLVSERFATGVTAARRRAARDELGLPHDTRVALIVTGSLGLGDVEHSARTVIEAGLRPLVLCGRNRELRERLSRIPGVVALGWRDDVHEIMHVVDVLVHNAGGLSLTEALVAGLPAVSYRCIPGHGRANAAVLDGAGLAPWAHDRDQFVRALQDCAGTRRALLPPDADPAQVILDLIEVSSPDSPAVSHRQQRRTA